jgi:hypothetical protein
MCVIVYKPEGQPFPDRATLARCFNANPDGAGLMYSHNDRVHIKKGLMTFEDFCDALENARGIAGDFAPFVLHFRISTQAGICPQCTHPYPLSPKMQDLKKLEAVSDIGIAHNGIIKLTSDGSTDHNDTMLFITDYLSKIIKSRRYYKSKKARDTIEGLARSRLAILDGAGHCELLGAGWIEDDGIFYSNSSYQKIDFWDFWDYDPADDFAYFFDPFDCPATLEGDLNFCADCVNFAECFR